MSTVTCMFTISPARSLTDSELDKNNYTPINSILLQKILTNLRSIDPMRSIILDFHQVDPTLLNTIVQHIYFKIHFIIVVSNVWQRSIISQTAYILGIHFICLMNKMFIFYFIFQGSYKRKRWFILRKKIKIRHYIVFAKFKQNK